MTNDLLDQQFEEVRQDPSVQRDVMHVHATLRIFHEDLEPHELTTRLGVDASQAHRRGDLVSGAEGTAHSDGAWLLDSKALIYLTDPNKHVEWVLDKVAHRTSVLRQLLQGGYHIDVLCTLLTKCTSTYPSLNAETIRRLGAIGISCSFRIQHVSYEEAVSFQLAKVASTMPMPMPASAGPPPKPTDQWKERALEFPWLYPMKGVLKVERVLDDFSTVLEKIYAEEQEQIEEAVKDAILELNKISDQFPILIETEQSEQLCLFLEEHARAVGLNIDDRGDITQKWRTW